MPGGGDDAASNPIRVSLRRHWSSKLDCSVFVVLGLDPGIHSPKIAKMHVAVSRGDLGKPV